jgi:hypothetical protein
MQHNLLAWLTALMLLAGCANRGLEHHFERTPAAIEASKTVQGQADRATVYFVRRSGLMQVTAIPRPPHYFAIDGKMLSVMPLDSHVVLSLEPGTHTFTRLLVLDGGIFPIRLNRVETAIELAGGETYFVVDKPAFLAPALSLQDETSGREALANTELAKLIHQPVSIDVFTSRIAAAEQKRKAGGSLPATSPIGQQSAPSSLQNALPSSKQIGDFLEVVATLALVAVLILGATTGSGASSNSPPPMMPNLSPPPAISAPASARAASIANTWRTSSGTLSEVLESKDETTLHNISSGVRYRIEDGRISGSDGSRYRVNGSTIFSDSGQTYRVIGDSIFASDGRSCMKTGTVVSCR